MSSWVVYAGYGMNGKYNDVSQLVQTQYAGGQKSFAASNSIYGPDPDPNVVKTLYIVYATSTKNAGPGNVTLNSAATTETGQPAILP